MHVYFMKCCMQIYQIAVSFLFQITAILSIYISATRSQPGLYIILGLSVLLLAAIEVIMASINFQVVFYST